MKSIAEAGRMLLGKMAGSSASSSSTGRRSSSDATTPAGGRGSTSTAGGGGAGRGASSSSHGEPIEAVEPNPLDALPKRTVYRANGTKTDLPTDDLLLVEQLAARRPGAALPRHWTGQEDEALRKAIEKFGERDWKAVAEQVPGRNPLQCVQRWKKTLMPGLIKGAWSQDEDLLLLSMMHEVAVASGVERDAEKMDWVQVATRMPGRNAKQCKERWALYLDPSIERGPWTAEEDAVLIRLHAEIGGRWVMIAKNMRDECHMARTEHSVKTRYMSLVRQAARARGWSPEEDFAVCKGFLQEGPEAGLAIARSLVGRTKAQVNKRWEDLVGLQPFLNEMYAGPFPRSLTQAELARIRPTVPASPPVSHVSVPTAEPPKMMSQTATSTSSVSSSHWPMAPEAFLQEVTRLRHNNTLEVKLEDGMGEENNEMFFPENESPDASTSGGGCDLSVKLLTHALSSSEFAVSAQPPLDDPLSYFEALEIEALLSTDQDVTMTTSANAMQQQQQQQQQHQQQHYPQHRVVNLPVTTSELYDEMGMQRKAMRQYQSSLVSL